ncbi:organomercurial lyase [Pseudonocardia nigra]|uniref:organomercurial lyase n=1 Tax=Pseudonocardia nigra TaxID=1921578 RepID=UPI001C6000C9|nr:organomercurial lyase [Pseudonocardia nigra]
MTAKLEVLHVPDCPNLPPLLDRLRALTDLPITTREIRTTADAAAFGMAGSPTLLVNGRDPFQVADRPDHGVACRIYRDEHGRPVPAPSLAQLRTVLAAAGTTLLGEASIAADGRSAECAAGEPAQPGAVLSAWRTRAVPLDPVEKAVHQAILRGFAATGQAPAESDLDPVTARAGRSTSHVLSALHELDPPMAVVSRVRPDSAVADVRAEICALGNFFSSADAAADWQAHYPQGALVPITEDFAVNREAVIELRWAATRA